MTDISTTALNSRAQSLNTSPAVIQEVRGIEVAVQQAVQAGLLSTTISGTVMTTPTSTPNTPGSAEYFFRVWRNLITDRYAQLQITTVMAYFTNNGYSLTQVVNPSTNTTFLWVIQW